MAMKIEQQNTPLSEALRLAKHGIKTIQLHWPTGKGTCSCGNPRCGKSVGKHPLLSDWANHGVNHPDTLRKLWKTTPQSNVGVPMGKVNGLFALDIDGQEGQFTLQRWIEEYGDLPATWQVLTGGGGMQLWYRMPEGLDVPNSVKKVGLNIDIRGTGGQSVAPGSLHQSGRRYQWIPGRSPDDLLPAEPPEWLVDKIREVIRDQQQAKRAGIQLENITVTLDESRKPAFERLVQLRQSSFKFREIIDGKKTFQSPSERDLAMANIAAVKGWTDQEIADLLIMYRNSQGDDLKHPFYYQLTIGKARQWAKEQGIKTEPVTVTDEREVEPIPLPEKPRVEPFPVEVFPDAVRRLIEAVSHSVGSPPDFTGVHSLTALGAAIGSTRVLQIKPDYQQQANLYAGVVAVPSTGKSPAQTPPFEPLKKLQEQYARLYLDEKDEYETRRLSYEVELAEWKKRKKKGADEDPPAEPKPPAMRDILTTQATVEALFRMLKDNPRGIVIKLDELAGLMQSLGQYKGGGDDREQFLSMWTGGELKIDRVRNRERGELLYLPRTFVSISGNLPTSQLGKLAGQEEDGFIDRFLLAFPDNQKMKEDEDFKGVSDEVKAEYNRVVERLYSLKPLSAGDRGWQPQILILAEEAKEWWREWKQVHARETNDPDLPRRLVSVWGKMENQLARLSLIIHMIRVVHGEAEDGELDAISLSKGIQLIRYFKSHARKIYQQLDQTPVDQRIEEAVEWIRKRGGTVQRRDVQRYKITGCKKRSDVEELFRELEDFGYGKVIEIKPKRGPKTMGFQLFE
jgi:hypothetical protein